MKNTKRKGFTLIELVIVVAIIGILALMIIPQFNKVTKDAKIKTFESNCQTVVSAIGMYQAGNNGNYPNVDTDLDPYINGGWAGVKGPENATYTYTKPTFTATYTDDDNYTHNFTYPTGGGTGSGAATGGGTTTP